MTMQVARNFFLTREKTITRKLREVLLAWKIEANLSKDEILQLYVNQIFLGQRAYGFAAAAQIYFGKALRDLSPAEAAMLAGLPKAPSSYNPVSNPKRAKTRQLYVLRRMHDLKYISSEQYREAQTAPLAVRQGLREALPTHAEFVAEMARQVVFDAYGEDAYTKGLTVQTTIRKADQEAAYARGAARRDRLRPPARIPGPGGLRPPAGRRRPSAKRCWSRCSRTRATATASIAAVVTEASPTAGQGGAAPTARSPRSPAMASSSSPARSATRPRRRRASAPARSIRLARDAKGKLGDHPAAAGGVRVRLRCGPWTAPSLRWSAAGASSATSSTT